LSFYPICRACFIALVKYNDDSFSAFLANLTRVKNKVRKKVEKLLASFSLADIV
jgi:hypothetical protein